MNHGGDNDGCLNKHVNEQDKRDVEIGDRETGNSPIDRSRNTRENDRILIGCVGMGQLLINGRINNVKEYDGSLHRR